MKRFITLSFCIIIILTHANGQEFIASVSSDSILAGNYLELKYHIKNIDGKFEISDLSEFEIISGPNVSSSMQIVNGQYSSSKTYSYFIRPKEIGQCFIGPAYLFTQEDTLETSPIEIYVHPNSEGIINPPATSDRSKAFGLGWPPEHKREDSLTIKEKRLQKKLKKI